MNFQEKLATYAELLITHGLNVQPGQSVNITAEMAHRELVQLLVKAAYKAGAKFVNVDYIDPYLQRLRIVETKNEADLAYVPRYTQVKYNDFVEEGACILRLCGSEEPDVMSDLAPAKVNSVQSGIRQALKAYYVEGVGKSKVQWTVAAAATPKWAKKLYPELDDQSAYNALWEAIFQICRADSKECLAAWQKHQVVLQKRAKALNDLEIRELHFVGPGTDLKVILSPKARFKAGHDKTPTGIFFEPNIPTEECFTTPDCRYTEGTVRVTRPVTVNGKLVQGLELEFRQGEISNFRAKEGQESFAAYIANDPGAKRLGEMALVGIDSPVFQSGKLFQEILYDENAACHIALGFAYRHCLKGGPQMSNEELQELGCNDSFVHIDFMISSPEVDVIGTTYSGQKVQLLKKGLFELS